MGLYRSPSGAIEEIPDSSASTALAGGYVPISSAQAGAPVESSATGGVLGTLGAGATSVLSGATLGLSDLALKGILSRGDAARLLADREANPVTSGAGQVLGAIAPTLLSGGSLAPSALVSRGVSPLIERGGIEALIGGGIEGAAQNVGAYLSDTALNNRDLSAEGISGALGSGFAFGSVGAGAAMGIEKGTIAARRMFSRLVDGGDEAATQAAQAWQTQYQATIDAHSAALDIAKAELAKARAASEAAGLGRDRASAGLAQIQALAPEIDAAHAAATGLDAKVAAIEAQEASRIAPGTYEDLQRLVDNHEAKLTELDDLLRKIEAPELGPPEPAVPIGEFGAPGQRGIKSPADLEIAASEASSIADSTRAARPSAMAEGTPVESGIPQYDAIRSHESRVDDYLERTVQARDIADRGYYEPPGGNEDAVRIVKAKQAIVEGQREPIKLNVSPEGKITVTDGRHRLAAAIEADVPIKVKWSTGFEPAPSDVLRGGKPTETLTGLLRGTQEKLAFGESLQSIGASSPARTNYVAEKAARGQAFRERNAPMAKEEAAANKQAFAQRAGIGEARRNYQVRQLEVAKDAAVERAATATNDIERATATAEARAIDAQITKLGKMPNVIDDIASVSKAITAYEKSGAELTEGMGELAPPMAKEHAAAFRTAEDSADRKLTDRTTRAIDDNIDKSMPDTWKKFVKSRMSEYMKSEGGHAGAMKRLSHEWGSRTESKVSEYKASGTGLDRRPSANPPAKVKIGEAKQSLREADAAYRAARVTESEARIGVRQAKEARAAIPEPPTPTSPVAAKPSALGAILTTAGVAGELGIPGIPNPHDIPVIGPLLSAYLKYRVLKAAMGRFTGRVAATGDARAAALVAKTKQKVAIAIDRTLGLAAETAPKARGTIVATTVALGRRVFDDGEPNHPSGATPQAQAAVRVREIMAANSHPELIQAQVRREMHGVMDPDLIDAAEKHLINMFSHLASVAPQPPPDNDYAKRPWQPSQADTHELSQRLAVINDPVHALNGPMSPAAADTFRNVHSQLYELAKNRLIYRVSELDVPMPRDARLRASALFQLPIDVSMDLSHVAIVRAPPKPEPQPSPIARLPNVSSMYSPENTRVK